MARLVKPAAALILVAAICCGGYFVHRTNEAVKNAYAVWWVADMVIEYMKANDGRWPKSWDDLRQPYEICTNRSGRPWTFDELESRAAVDWNADPAELVRSTLDLRNAEPAFRVIWLRDGSESHWQTREPNRMVLEYLQTKKRHAGNGDGRGATADSGGQSH